jgi:polar amino acid transport system substrate-binding protein
VEAVVYDAPILRYYLSEHPGTRLQLVGDAFDKQNYGFPMQQQSPFRKEINRALLKVAEEGYFVDLDKKWFATVSE